MKQADERYYSKNSRAPSLLSLIQASCHVLTVIGVVLGFLYYVLLPGYSRADSFNIPEKLVYDLKWMGIKAGTASLEIINEENTTKIISQAYSAKFLSLFYKVDDRIVSTLSKGSPLSPIGQSKRYRVKLREGKHRRDKEVIFDHDKRKALFIDYRNNEKVEFEVPSSVFDPISGFYYLRTLELVVGDPVYVTIFDSKKVWDVEVQVLREEKIALPAGTFDTIVVKPLLKSEGIFFRKGDVHIWLTDDLKHIPVLVKLKVAIGHVTATLMEGMY